MKWARKRLQVQVVAGSAFCPSSGAEVPPPDILHSQLMLLCDEDISTDLAESLLQKLVKCCLSFKCYYLSGATFYVHLPRAIHL